MSTNITAPDGAPFYYCACTESRPIEALVPHPANPNTHPDAQIALLANIIKAQGWRNPIVVSDRSGYIIKGHARRLAALKLGLTEVPVDLQHYADEATEMADMIADNRIAELAEIDDALLKDALQHLDTGAIDMTLTGFTMDELASMLTTAPPPTPEAQTDKADELQAKWNVQPGDVYSIGSHRLICGDCRDAETVAKLLAGARPSITFTSPPYNQGQQGFKAQDAYAGAVNDDLQPSEYLGLLNGMLATASAVTEWQFVNLQLVAGNKITLIEWLNEHRDHLADIAIWNKGFGQPAMEPNIMNSAFEFVFVFSNKPTPTRHLPGPEFRGTISNVYSQHGNTENAHADSHNAAMPTDFAAHFIKAHATQSVFEPFCGTGTTIAACQHTNKVCYAVELVPKFVAVTLDRLEQLGLKVEKLTA